MAEVTPDAVLDRYRRAKERRAVWEAHWQECYDYALPLRDSAIVERAGGEKKTDRLFDATAPDAVDQLAAALLALLTPAGSQWFGFEAGAEADGTGSVQSDLEQAARRMRTHFDRSNFAVEMHQSFLDLVTVGTACLLFEEAPPGEASAFRFTAVPLGQVVLEESGAGRLDTAFRRSELTADQMRTRFPGSDLPPELARRLTTDPEARAPVVEAVSPDGGAMSYLAILETAPDPAASVLRRGRFAQSPFIAFRWIKSPGEDYGRSPVMKALPDIKTANKVVELVLKNASIAVTGIWQADDDGVLNPATIKLVPGTIIPKAVGSAGLTPLTPPGQLDTSQVVLESLRANIRRALLADKLGPPEGSRMTATEVLERAADMSRLLGATYGRLQSELLNPLILRARAILRRRGEWPDLRLDGRQAVIRYRSPLAQDQARDAARNVALWLDGLQGLGPAAAAVVDAEAAARWLARAFGVPDELLMPPADIAPIAPPAGGPGDVF